KVDNVNFVDDPLAELVMQRFTVVRAASPSTLLTRLSSLVPRSLLYLSENAHFPGLVRYLPQKEVRQSPEPVRHTASVRGFPFFDRAAASLHRL
ncbi:MAG TPA: hypothetical protein VF775_05600, partial [Geobacteraceae bacterium]